MEEVQKFKSLIQTLRIPMLLLVLGLIALPGCEKKWGRKQLIGTWKLEKSIGYNFEYNSDSTEVTSKFEVYSTDWAVDAPLDSNIYVFTKDSFKLISTYANITSYGRDLSMINEVAFADYYNTHVWGDTNSVKLNKARLDHYSPELFFITSNLDVDQAYGATIIDEELHIYHYREELIFTEVK